ncbi:uncharacterized protein LOC122077827 [Macadamia integrifolia]|uniref:uncharacterized protein LOC122077827 n=1 Tax=Macadamia integrifolia TaxID=60698 RepID=UPI001C4F3A05|nr:uncharacterized protein LOC122077827 [Macadamia integrifolia]XP_042499670.1 uncharacterized protein LOC122077827 [Macadamia integrifolia]
MGVCVEHLNHLNLRPRGFLQELCDLREEKIVSCVLTFQNLPPMPSVGMRRSTRVFVPKSVVKDADGVRVLRSGKRLGSESAGGKGKGSDSEPWFRLLDHSGDADGVLCCKNDGCHNALSGEGVDVKHLDGEMAPGSMNNGPGVSMTNASVDRMHGNVYHRKRQRLGGNKFSSSSLTSGGGDRVYEDRMYGIPFVRKQRRKKRTGSFSTVIPREMRVVEDNKGRQVRGFLQQDLLLNCFSSEDMVLVVTKPTVGNTSRFACLLNSILSYMTRNRVRLSELSAFLCSKPIAIAFSRNSIRLLQDNLSGDTEENDILASGICKIFEAPCFTPLFSMDFLSVPSAFIYLHSRVLLWHSCLPNVLLQYLMGLYTEARRFSDSQSCLSCISSEVGLSGSEIMTSESTYTGKKEVGFVAGAPKSSGRGASRRYGSNPRSIQKRSRMGSVRGRSLSISESQSSGSVVGTDLLSSVAGCPSFSLLVPNRRRRSCTSNGLGEYMKELKSTLVELRQNMDSLSCSANILIIEPDKCYREEGADVSLEFSTSNEWLIVVRRHGSLRYCYKAQNMMRPSTTNRFTHAMVWGGGNGWKLEFLDRREWLIFKELHKECYGRNMQTASLKVIPVPGVHEVPENGDNIRIPFVQPERYITMKEDEVARALMKREANYDIQSDDEEFLSILNNEFNGGENDGSENISANKFEKIIDLFEKTAYCSPDDVADESKAANLCLNMGRREILVPIYNYWIKKRKQKRSALVRVFQSHPPRRAELIQKPFLRKKRSFKRKGYQYGRGRGKQPSFLKAMADEQDVLAAKHRFEEANNSARRLLEAATLKRQRAQVLMENADLATYKATIALRLTEAIERSELCDVGVAMDSFVG